MNYLICGKCRRVFNTSPAALVSSRRRDGWMAIRCTECGGMRAARKAESRREYKLRMREEPRS